MSRPFLATRDRECVHYFFSRLKSPKNITQVSRRARPWRRTTDVIQYADTPPPKLHPDAKREFWGVTAAVAGTVLLVIAIYAVLRWTLTSLHCCARPRDRDDMVLVKKKLLERYQRMESLSRHPAPAVTEVFQSVAGEVTVVAVERNGDSLFAALAHQLYDEPIGSPDHLQDTDMLRKLAVRCLRRYPQLKEDILRSLADHKPRYAHLTEEAAIDQFLTDLGQPGFPAGRESMRALADVTQTHIVVYPELSHVYEVSSTTSAFTTVGISQRVVLDEQGRAHLHYDSVLEVKPALPPS